MVTLLGRNGAGKTTTLKSVMGLVPRREGSIRYREAEIVSLMANQIARAGIAFCPEERGIFGSLNVMENLLLPPVVAPGGLRHRDDLHPVSQSGRSAWARRTARGCRAASSRCWRSRASCAPGPGLLLLDEPTEGLAPVIVQQIGRTIREIKSRGFTVLLVEQNFRFAATVADRHYVMDQPARSST